MKWLSSFEGLVYTWTSNRSLTRTFKMSQLRGLSITQQEQLDPVNISWKQGSFIGFGGDKSQSYNVFVYTLKNGGSLRVFVQDDMDAPSSCKIDKRFQFGCQNGDVFLVLHGKDRKPYQHRFVENQGALAQWAMWTGQKIKENGKYDVKWIAGDYLREF